MARSKFYSRQYTGWPPVKILEYEDSDSYHWQNRANDMRHWLELKMGEGEFLGWFNRLFPGGDASEATWKEIFELYEAKFRVIQGEEREAERAEQARDEALNDDSLTHGPLEETTEVVMVDDAEIPFGYRVPKDGE